MYDTYIFDLDGTLLDTIGDLAVAVNYALKKNNLPPKTLEEISRFVGNGVLKLIERAIGRSNADVLTVLKDFKSYYHAHNAVTTKPYDGIIELLRELKRLGKKIVIVSNKYDAATKKLSEIYFGDLIDFAIGENEDGGIKKKPAPDSVNFALETLKAKKESAVYVGDSEVDIQTAVNAQIPCVSVLWGLRDEKFLRENGGNIFVKTPQEILNI